MNNPSIRILGTGAEPLICVFMGNCFALVQESLQYLEDLSV